MRPTRLVFLAPIVLAGLCAASVGAATSDGTEWQGRSQNRARVSPRATVEAEIDGCKITIEYGRPYKRERVIWGTLVPWDKWWMPGADESSSIQTDKDLVIGGTLVMPAGLHTIYTLPREEHFTLIINKETGQFHTVYHADRDLGRVPMTKEMRTDVTEQMTFAVEAAATGGGLLKLLWDDRQYVVSLKRGSDVDPSKTRGGARALPGALDR